MIRWRWLWWLFLTVTLVACGHSSSGVEPDAPTLSYPLLFVTQVPVPADYTTIGAVFGNQRADLQSVARGGDLWMRYPDGALKNLTQTAGYGMEGFQGAAAIAVRDPAVHWDGQKAVFSMVVGAPTQQYQVETYYWQLYEITGLGFADTPVITKVPHQPPNANNVSPIYGSDDRIIFTSDRPRNGAPHLYPQLDEYETAPTVSGLWSLDPTSGDLRLLNHAPSGDFTPLLDSFGRVVFTQWDHLQRDQQADSETPGTDCYYGADYGTFNYADESAGAAMLDERTEYFPEPRSCRNDLLAGTHLDGHSFNHFFPWQMNEDGTELETLNHVGRHELHAYIGRSFNNDPNVVEYYGQYERFNDRPINNMLQMAESVTMPGLYLGVDAPEFGTHAAGQVIALNGSPTLNADQMQITYVTHRDTAYASEDPGPEHSGLYRDPLPLSNGLIVVAHTDETREDENEGSRAFPQSRYAFRLQPLVSAGDDLWRAGAPLTAGISETISYWDPDVWVTYSGALWEWQPVEVRPRPRPDRLVAVLPAQEQAVFAAAGVDVADFQAYLAARSLALVVSRNVTTRDDQDRQQPFNLRIAGTNTQTIGANGTIYDVSTMQFFQGDLLRGWMGGGDTVRPGRRVLAQMLHDPAALAANLAAPDGPPGSVVLGADGSMAAIVPAQRALTWQLTDENGVGVVRERYWLTFQPGEIRVCTSCHGLNNLDQAHHTAPTNEPQALLALLQAWDVPPPMLPYAVFVPVVRR